MAAGEEFKQPRTESYGQSLFALKTKTQGSVLADELSKISFNYASTVCLAGLGNDF